MKFSIIVPVYNRYKLFPICIRKMLEAKQTDYEIILVDDGSTDNTLLECKKIASEFPNVHAYHQENKGVSAARNYGLEKAKGEYIMFVDSDDFISPNSFPYIDQMSENDVDMIMFRHDYINTGNINIPVSNNTSAEQPLKIEGNKSIVNWIFTTLNPYEVPYYSVWGKVIKKDFLDKHNIRFREDISLGEDNIFICEILCHINTFMYTENKYYNIVLWPTSMRAFGLGSYHRSMDNYLHNQLANYNEFLHLYLCSDLVCVKEYAVNYIIDRPITRILFRNADLRTKNRTQYRELSQFCRKKILPVIKLESDNISLLRDKRIAFVAKMILEEYPFGLIFTYCFIEENLLKRIISLREKAIRKILSLFIRK